MVATFDTSPQRLDTFLPGLVGRLSGGGSCSSPVDGAASCDPRAFVARGTGIEAKPLDLLAGDLRKRCLSPRHFDDAARAPPRACRR